MKKFSENSEDLQPEEYKIDNFTFVFTPGKDGHFEYEVFADNGEYTNSPFISKYIKEKIVEQIRTGKIINVIDFLRSFYLPSSLYYFVLENNRNALQLLVS